MDKWLIIGMLYSQSFPPIFLSDIYLCYVWSIDLLNYFIFILAYLDEVILHQYCIDDLAFIFIHGYEKNYLL
jgi:hypothetical protein